MQIAFGAKMKARVPVEVLQVFTSTQQKTKKRILRLNVSPTHHRPTFLSHTHPILGYIN